MHHLDFEHISLTAVVMYENKVQLRTYSNEITIIVIVSTPGLERTSCGFGTNCNDTQQFSPLGAAETMES